MIIQQAGYTSTLVTRSQYIVTVAKPHRHRDYQTAWVKNDNKARQSLHRTLTGKACKRMIQYLQECFEIDRKSSRDEIYF